VRFVDPSAPLPPEAPRPNGAAGAPLRGPGAEGTPGLPSRGRAAARIAELRARCTAAGIPLTAQRREILSVLLQRDDHPTVDQIHSAVQERLPDISRATVYRTLETLSELGLLQRVEHPGSAVRFDANMAPHHHFLCRRCHALVDLPLEAIQGHQGLAFVGDPTLRVEEVAIVLRGTCPACAASQGGA